MGMFKKFYGLSSIIAVVALIFLAVPAMSQEPTPSKDQGQPGATESRPQVSDENLKKAAEAYTKIVAISEEFHRSVQKTQDKKERQKLQYAANQKMVQAVENTGLDVETYDGIMTQIRADERISQRFHQLVQKAQ